jgi:hypothetical protein
MEPQISLTKILKDKGYKVNPCGKPDLTVGGEQEVL